MGELKIHDADNDPHTIKGLRAEIKILRRQVEKLAKENLELLKQNTALTINAPHRTRS